MKKSNYALTAAMVAAIASGAASASNRALTEDADVIINLSGATAQNANIKNAVGTLCQSGTLETYSSKSSSSRYIDYFCLSSDIQGLTNGQKILIRYSSYSTVVGNTTFAPGTSASGSLLGAAPIVTKNKINFMAVSKSTPVGACVESTTTPSTFTCDDAVPGVLVPYVSQLGTSDLHPRMFVLQNAPYEAGAVSSADVAKLKIIPGPVTIFNTPVTKVLRDALQDVQLKNGELVKEGCADLSDREKGVCTPNLSADHLQKIWLGEVSSWKEIIPELGDKPIKLVRRDIGSGTGGSLNIAIPSKLYTDLSKAYPCVAGAQPPIYSGVNVAVAAGGSDMETALVNLSKAGDYGMGILNPTANGAGANVGGSKDYRYIRIEGKAPTLVAAAAGEYKFVTQSTFQRLATGAGTNLEVALMDALVAKATDPTIIGKGNAGLTYKQNFGNSGYLAVRDASCKTAAECDTNPVTNFRFASNPAAEPNNCVAPKAVW
jgi:hypothetical protein